MKNMIKVRKKIYLGQLSPLFRPGGCSLKVTCLYLIRVKVSSTSRIKFNKLLSKEY